MSRILPRVIIYMLHTSSYHIYIKCITLHCIMARVVSLLLFSFVLFFFSGWQVWLCRLNILENSQTENAAQKYLPKGSIGCGVIGSIYLYNVYIIGSYIVCELRIYIYMCVYVHYCCMANIHLLRGASSPGKRYTVFARTKWLHFYKSPHRVLIIPSKTFRSRAAEQLHCRRRRRRRARTPPEHKLRVYASTYTCRQIQHIYRVVRIIRTDKQTHTSHNTLFAKRYNGRRRYDDDDDDAENKCYTRTLYNVR